MRVVEARNLKEPNYLSTSDPYAKIQVAGTLHQTQVCNNGGRKPQWDCKLPPMIVKCSYDCVFDVCNKDWLMMIGAQC